LSRSVKLARFREKSFFASKTSGNQSLVSLSRPSALLPGMSRKICFDGIQIAWTAISIAATENVICAAERVPALSPAR
jgi:hypothetical protein